jgi:nicotinamide mononucleotide transporter
MITDINTIIEILGAVTGLVAVFLNSKRISGAWLLGLIGIITSGIVFFNASLYAETGLQIVFGLSGIYGYFQWRVNGEQKQILKPRYTTLTRSGLYLLLLIVVTGNIYFLLTSITDSTTPLPDAAITGISLVAQIMLAKQEQENWYLWTIANLISIPLYMHKGIYIYAGLYVGYLALGLYGLYTWHRLIHNSKSLYRNKS